MTEPHEPEGAQDAEVVDGEVVEAFDGLRAAVPPPAAPMPAQAAAAPQDLRAGRGTALGGVRSMPVAAQAAAVAATGFAAGAVTAAVVRKVARRHGVKAGRRPAKGALPVVGTRSFLVDVHLLGPRE